MSSRFPSGALVYLEGTRHGKDANLNRHTAAAWILWDLLRENGANNTGDCRNGTNSKVHCIVSDKVHAEGVAI